MGISPWRRIAVGVAGLAVLGLPGGCRFVTMATTSVTGQQANPGVTSGPTISRDGRFVAFDSTSTNLVLGDTNRAADIFVRDLLGRTTQRLSVAYDGGPADGDSTSPRLSADGRYAVYKSDADNLVPGDTNGTTDVFVTDRIARTTQRVSVASDGTQANGESSRYASPATSPDGKVVAFVSLADNLVPGDVNGTADTFVHDLATGVTELVDVASDGTQGDGWAGGNLAVSGDGRYVAFPSVADNLVPGDTNGHADVFVRDRVAHTTEVVSQAADGGPSDGEVTYLGIWITPDGRYVSFRSLATNLVPGDTNGVADVFVRDRVAGATERVSVASGGAEAHGEQWEHVSDASISDDGRFVLFDSWATDLVPGDTNRSPDVFVHDRTNGRTDRVSVSPLGDQAGSYSGNSQISGDGAYAAFGTVAQNIIPGDSNDSYDIAVAYVAQPQVEAVAPSALVPGTVDVPVTVTGAWFRTTADLWLGDGVAVHDVQVVDSSTIHARVDVATGAAPGARQVVVRDVGRWPPTLAGGIGECTGCVTVVAP